MRKILAGFLAAAMIASIGATATFALATVTTPPSISASISGKTESITAVSSETYDGTADTVKPGESKWSLEAAIDEVEITVAGSTFTIPVNSSSVTLSSTADATLANVAGEKLNFPAIAVTSGSFSNLDSVLNGLTFHDVNINGAYFNGSLSVSGGNITVKFDQAARLEGAGAAATVKVNGSLKNPTASAMLTTTATAADRTVNPSVTLNQNTFSFTDSGATVKNPTVGETTNNETSGDFDTANVKISDVLKAYGTGEPIPLTENPRGVDKDLNYEGGVQSGATVYFMIRDDKIPKMNDDNYWKIKLTKGDNGKYVSSWDDVNKNFSKNLYDANTGKEVSGTGGARHRYIKVELKDIYTDDEIKISFDMRISAQSNAVNMGIVDSDDTEIKIKDFYFYMKNVVKNADGDWKVGIGGLMLNPVSNDWNEVTYYDESHDVAFMKFFADSDTDKFFAKLSTKWEHMDYASYFNDQDAYIFDFVGSPKISSTSRCDLQIYNPFINEDGDERIDPTTATIYQVMDGDLFDVTDTFKYEEGDNGDMAFTTRTRFLGTYIICEKPVEEASSSTETPDEVLPEAPAETPIDTPVVTPPDDGGKKPANTGKYL